MNKNVKSFVASNRGALAFLLCTPVASSSLKTTRENGKLLGFQKLVKENKKSIQAAKKCLAQALKPWQLKFKAKFGLKKEKVLKIGASCALKATNKYKMFKGCYSLKGALQKPAERRMRRRSLSTPWCGGCGCWGGWGGNDSVDAGKDTCAFGSGCSRANYCSENPFDLRAAIDKKMCYEPIIMFGPEEDGGPIFADAAPPGSGDGDSVESASETNSQVDGIDEADILKTDGVYVYTFSKNGTSSNCASVSIAHALTLNVVSVIAAGTSDFGFDSSSWGSTAFDMFAHKSKDSADGSDRLVLFGRGRKDCEDQMVVRVYDIKDKASPRLVRQISVKGSYKTARKVGSDIIIVHQKYGNVYFGKNTDNPGGASFLPAYKDHVFDGEGNVVGGTGQKFKPVCNCNQVGSLQGDGPDGGDEKDDDSPSWMSWTRDQNFISVSRIDVEDDSAEMTSLVSLGYGGSVMMSHNAVYVATQSWRWGAGQSTEIVRFDLGALMGDEDAPFPVITLPSIPGSLNNQWSMDEHSGMLRVTTVEWQWNNPASRTNNRMTIIGVAPSNDSPSSPLGAASASVKMLRPDPLFSIVSMISGLGKPNERIMSTRFHGSRGYIVTFQQTDPLIVLDLSDPGNPKVAGELEITGFSSYMHPFTSESGSLRILGIGQEANEAGVQTGMKMTIFEVTDPSKPSEHCSFHLGARGSSSKVSSDHKSFQMIGSTAIFPATVYAKDWQYDHQGLYLVDIETCEQVGPGHISHVSFATGFDESAETFRWCNSHRMIERSSWIQRKAKLDVYASSAEVLTRTSYSRDGEWTVLDQKCTKSSELGSKACVRLACSSSCSSEKPAFVCASKGAVSQTFLSDCAAKSCGFTPFHQGKCGSVRSRGESCTLDGEDDADHLPLAPCAPCSSCVDDGKGNGKCYLQCRYLAGDDDDSIVVMEPGTEEVVDACNVCTCGTSQQYSSQPSCTQLQLGKNGACGCSLDGNVVEPGEMVKDESSHGTCCCRKDGRFDWSWSDEMKCKA